MVELNSKQRKFLEKEAHNLSPVVIIGGAGVTEGVINMVSSSIASHELIKVKFNEYKEEKKELTEEILVKLSRVYNVTTDYILKLTDKRN